MLYYTFLEGMEYYLTVVLICISLMTGDVEWTLFHVLIGHLYVFFTEMFVHILCLFLN